MFAAAGSSALQGLAQIQMGRAAAAQGQARKEELEREAQLAEIGAKESQSARLQELQRTLGGIAALSGARNVNPDSPSVMAMEAAARRFAGEDIRREQFNTRQGAANMRLAGETARRAGRARATGYYLSAGSSFLKAGSELA